MGLSSVGAIPASSFMGDKNSYWRPILDKARKVNGEWEPKGDTSPALSKYIRTIKIRRCLNVK